MTKVLKKREAESGSAGAKFAVVFGIIALVLHAGINYVPVAYDGESLKGEMETAVLQGLALPGRVSPAENVKARIQKAMQLNNTPPEAILDVKMAGNSNILARVAYTKSVNLLPFGIYKYNYVFDHTATPAGFLLKQ
ncbi:MAG: hypothetical protein WBD16_16210 [Pyrinomonadaceae bacterium]|jgi:hypothetical protein